MLEALEALEALEFRPWLAAGLRAAIRGLRITACQARHFPSESRQAPPREAAAMEGTTLHH